MRVELLFELQKKELPKDNKSIWISFLKNVLSSCNGGKYYDRYFSGSKCKDYTYSVVFSKAIFSKEVIELDQTQVKMIFSADDRNRTGLIFLAAFLHAKEKNFPLPNDNAMTLKKVRECREQLIMSSKVLFRTVTGGGLNIREHDKETNRDTYYTVWDKGFEENFKRVIAVQAKKAGFSDSIASNVTLTPYQCKKVVVKQYGVYVDVTVGTFWLEGDPELLQYFYQAGIGSKHSFGYGMLDIVSQES